MTIMTDSLKLLIALLLNGHRFPQDILARIACPAQSSSNTSCKYANLLGEQWLDQSVKRKCLSIDGTHIEILLNQAEIRLYLPCTDWFGTANGPSSFAVRNRSVHGKYSLILVWFNKISFDLMQFGKDFSVCITGAFGAIKSRFYLDFKSQISSLRKKKVRHHRIHYSKNLKQLFWDFYASYTPSFVMISWIINWL